MENYKEMYLALFNGITDEIERLAARLIELDTLINNITEENNA